MHALSGSEPTNGAVLRPLRACTVQVVRAQTGAARRQLIDISFELRRFVRRKLLLWYERNQRDLPWRRRGHDAYAQWVAEIMLQQTQVETVVPYYERFMKRFASPASLARASEGEVLRLWQGLGYYRRALNLHRAAKQIASNGGAVPDSVVELAKLPGIGRYTAGAIASMAFDRRAAAVDGNVARVLSRLLHITEPVTDRDTMERIWSAAEQLLPTKRCGDFNQSLMDLGATVCVPGQPRCDACPLQRVCEAKRRGDAATLPKKAPARTVSELHHVVAVVRRGDSYLLVKRPSKGLWAGLWEFPNLNCEKPRRRIAALKRLLNRYADKTKSRYEDKGMYSHRLTHRLFHFHIYLTRLDLRRSTSVEHDGLRWVTERGLKRLPISTACRRIYALARE